MESKTVHGLAFDFLSNQWDEVISTLSQTHITYLQKSLLHVNNHCFRKELHLRRDVSASSKKTRA